MGMAYSYDRRTAASLSSEDTKAFQWLFNQRARAIQAAMGALGQHLKRLDKEFESRFPNVNHALIQQHLVSEDQKNDHGFWHEVEPYYSDESSHWQGETADYF
jgi:hypothetical protein